MLLAVKAVSREASLGRGKDGLSRLHDQDGHHEHIW